MDSRSYDLATAGLLYLNGVVNLLVNVVSEKWGQARDSYAFFNFNFFYF